MAAEAAHPLWELRGSDELLKGIHHANGDDLEQLYGQEGHNAAANNRTKRFQLDEASPGQSLCDGNKAHPTGEGKQQWKVDPSP